MPGPEFQTEPPTFYANVVTASVDPDAVYLELRRYLLPHKEMYRQAQDPVGAPQVSAPAEPLTAVEPIARIVLPYTAAKGLLANLNDLVPKMTLARQEPGGR